MLKIYSDDVFKKKHSMEKIFFFPCIFFPCLIFTLYNKLQRIESAEILFFFCIIGTYDCQSSPCREWAPAGGRRARHGMTLWARLSESFVSESFISQLRVSLTTKQVLQVMWIPRWVIVVQIFRPWNHPGLTGPTWLAEAAILSGFSEAN